MQEKSETRKCHQSCTRLFSFSFLLFFFLPFQSLLFQLLTLSESLLTFAPFDMQIGQTLACWTLTWACSARTIRLCGSLTPKPRSADRVGMVAAVVMPIDLRLKLSALANA